MPIQVECGNPSDPRFLVQVGPRLPVKIGLDLDAIQKSQHDPVLPDQDWWALVDTGAMECCIDSEVAATLGLPVVDRRKISGALGSGEVNVHIAQIAFPSLAFTVSGLFAGVHLIQGGQPFAALIGRTFLCYFKMTYDGPTGSVIVSKG